MRAAVRTIVIESFIAVTRSALSVFVGRFSTNNTVRIRVRRVEPGQSDNVRQLTICGLFCASSTLRRVRLSRRRIARFGTASGRGPLWYAENSRVHTMHNGNDNKANDKISFSFNSGARSTNAGLSKQGYSTLNAINHSAITTTWGVPKKRAKTEEE